MSTTPDLGWCFFLEQGEGDMTREQGKMSERSHKKWVMTRVQGKMSERSHKKWVMTPSAVGNEREES